MGSWAGNLFWGVTGGEELGTAGQDLAGDGQWWGRL